jgi:hypothetical protein
LPVIKRHSFLKRHSGMSRSAFSRHYLEHHGPLAAGLAGFQKFAFRYQQNHFDEDLTGTGDPPFDGLTMTFQVPREDYRQGFFQHPDYAKVRPDEEYLFDLSATVSVLGEEEIVFSHEAGGEKAIVLASGGDLRSGAFEKYGLRQAICNHLDTKTATALGFGKSAFAYERLWELYFASSDERRAACRDASFIADLSSPASDVRPLALAAREFVIF